ncbi:MAG: lytic transglycosylase domain-containing protein [Thermaurantiacus tibetensis]|uniref:lytic murein transglycosylase n=1 Tax=Thermaurantiacus tibetensis TaxID=2759035 RepID=UPI00188E3627|nr:lytic murein transglycosylase [Thermaurantiacus tibetensis]
MVRALLAAVALALLASPAPAQDAAAFDAWLARYRSEAEARGIPPAWQERALADVRFTPRVIALDRAQPDDSGRRNVFADYLARRLTAARIAEGQRMLARWEAAARAAEQAHGVPAAILLGIWGMESDFGRFTGSFDVLSALATLAFDGRRADLFTRELDAAIRMVGEGRASAAEMRGSWAGAMGQPQFLPSSYLAHAVDGDGDGRADIWTSVPDTLASIANYLKAAGWQAAVPWGLEVRVPAGFDRARVANPDVPTSCVRPLSRHSRPLAAGEWRALGFAPAAGGRWPADDVPMTLVEPDGPEGAAYLTTASYRALLAYNCSNFYALSVALLADAVAR